MLYVFNSNDNFEIKIVFINNNTNKLIVEDMLPFTSIYDSCLLILLYTTYVYNKFYKFSFLFDVIKIIFYLFILK